MSKALVEEMNELYRKRAEKSIIEDAQKMDKIREMISYYESVETLNPLNQAILRCSTVEVAKEFPNLVPFLKELKAIIG